MCPQASLQPFQSADKTAAHHRFLSRRPTLLEESVPRMVRHTPASRSRVMVIINSDSAQFISIQVRSDRSTALRRNRTPLPAPTESEVEIFKPPDSSCDRV